MKGLVRYYAFLAAAIALEVLGTTMMKMSEGFSHLPYTALFIISYAACFAFLTLALKKLPLGVAYGIWSGIGITVLTVIGAIVWGEPLNAIVMLGIALIVVGVVLLESAPKEQSGDEGGTPAADVK